MNTKPDVTFHMGVKGYFRIQKYGPDGDLRLDTGFFPNLILDVGLDQIGSAWGGVTSAPPSSLLGWIAIGSGSTAVDPSQTALTAQIARSSNQTTESFVASTGTPYYWGYTKTVRFNAGIPTGNIAELGVAQSNTGNLLSRALVLDEDGNPTTITVLVDETLDVTYQYRVYPNSNDVLLDIPISEATYTTTLRPGFITSTSNSSWNIYGRYVALYLNQSAVFAGGIGPITGGPTGANLGVITPSAAAYVAGNHYRDVTYTCGLADATNSIESMYMFGSFGYYQIGFTPSLPKTNSNILTLVFRFSWARYAP